ncbi:unnamed protein product [Allacma fusca]|uniref:DUF4806 domain-containing protein n=1 Tax=Allacma fusca TaxID=39272 RepID=A0A8J2K7P3_9HEXA|nr:unnamed protein product [Allacma fusca]
MNQYDTFEEASANVKHYEEFSDMSETDVPAIPIVLSWSGRTVKKRNLEFEISKEVFIPTVPTTAYDELLCEFREFQNTCFRNHATIQANQSSMMKMMDAILYNSKASIPIPPSSHPVRTNFGFPFQTMASLLAFDEKIVSDENFRSACNKYLGSIGGCDVTAIVFVVLKKILSFELAYEFNFTGVHGKANFSLLNLNDLIFDVLTGQQNCDAAINIGSLDFA